MVPSCIRPTVVPFPGHYNMKLLESFVLPILLNQSLCAVFMQYLSRLVVSGYKLKKVIVANIQLPTRLKYLPDRILQMQCLWPFSRQRQIIRLRRVNRLQIPSKLTEKHMDDLKQIIRPKLNRPVFILLRTVRLTDNPYL